MRLAGKVATITGGGGGIGRATALRFCAEGARVVVGDVDEQAGARTVEAIEAAGGEALFLRVDVTQPDKTAEFMRRASDWGGGLDVLFNNAGIGPPSDTTVTEITEEAWHAILGVNLTGVFLCSKYGIPHLVARGGGSVVNTSSIAGIKANTAIPSTAYTVSKAGVAALTKQCAVDFASAGVRVNAICPGPIDTPILDPFMSDPRIKRRFSAEVPLGRIGQPDDVASLVLFLASSEAAWITGATIAIDGGITAG
jgi:NAD(P)-dependent dehydrogenase (short-subunit alcohol dehydrogenase family)